MRSKQKRVRLPVLLFPVTLFLIGISACKDIIFNNPLDPDASRDVVQVIKVIETQLDGIGDIAYDGEKIWKINPFGNLAAFDRESGTMIRSFFSSGGTGVSFFRNSIYLGGLEEGNVLVTIDPLSGDTLNRISTRDLYPAFLTPSNNTLIVYDERSYGVFQYDPETGEAVRLFVIAGLNIGGIALYKGGLLISDMNTDSLYRFTLTGTVTEVYSSPAPGIGGLAVDESDYVYIFILDGKIYKVSLP
jgi:outer membrane protein assembly factor BamB